MMNRSVFLRTLAAGLCLTSLSRAHESHQSQVAGLTAEQLSELEAQVSKVLEGYNSQSWKAFYASGWAEQTRAIQTELAFNTLYRDLAFKNFGAVKTRSLLSSESTFSELVGLLVYQGQFAKKAGKISVNFFKEDGAYRIQQLRIDP